MGLREQLGPACKTIRPIPLKVNLLAIGTSVWHKTGVAPSGPPSCKEGKDDDVCRNRSRRSTEKPVMCRNPGALMLQYCQISDEVRKQLRCCPRTPRSSASAPGEARVPEPEPACVSMGLLSPHLKFTKKEGNHCICMRPSLRAFVNAAQKFVTTVSCFTMHTFLHFLRYASASHFVALYGRCH